MRVIILQIAMRETEEKTIFFWENILYFYIRILYIYIFFYMQEAYIKTSTY